MLGCAIAATVMLALLGATWALLPRLAPEWTLAHAPWRSLRARAALQRWAPDGEPLARTAPPWARLPDFDPLATDQRLAATEGDALGVLAVAAADVRRPGAAFIAVLLLNERARWQDRDPRIADALAAAARGPHPGLRMQALFGLAGIGDARGMPPLIGLAEAGTAGERRDAIRALGSWGDPWLLLWGPITFALTYAPGEHGAPSAVPVLLRCLTDDDRSIRAAALSALARIGDPATAPALAAAIDRDRPSDEQLDLLAQWSDPGLRAALRRHGVVLPPADRPPTLEP